MKIASVGQNSYQRKTNTNLKKDEFATSFKMSKLLKNLDGATREQLIQELADLKRRLKPSEDYGGDSENIKRLKAAKAKIENILDPPKKVENQSYHDYSDRGTAWFEDPAQYAIEHYMP